MYHPSYKKSQKGFTLIELVVAAGVFSIVIIIILGIFGTFVRKQRHDIAEQQLLENMRFALEFFNREARTGYGDTYKLTASTGSSLIFRNQNSACVHYRLQEGRLERAEVPTSSSICQENDFRTAKYAGVTDSSVRITSLRFDVFPSQVSANRLRNQGFITTIVEATPKEKGIEPVRVQSTITSRQISPY